MFVALFPKKAMFKKYTESEFRKLVTDIAQNAGIEKLPPISFGYEGIGGCSASKLGFVYVVTELKFSNKCLDGETFDEKQIKNIIKHELAHMLAFQRYNEDCEHDERFKKIVKELGGEEDEEVITRYYGELSIEQIAEKRSFNVGLLCSKCHREIITSDELTELMLTVFIVSNTNFPYIVTIEGLPTKSNCCEKEYMIEADANVLLHGLQKLGRLSEVQESLKRLIQEKTFLRK